MIDYQLERVAQQHTLAVLEQCEGNKSEAARQLGVDRGTVARKIRLNLDGKPRKRSTCKCGRVGVQTRGCGKSHKPLEQTPIAPDIVEQALGTALARALTPPAEPMTAIAPTPRNLKPTPAAVELARRRSAERQAAAALDGAGEPARVVDDNPNARERWSARRIAAESATADAHKRRGSLPKPRSSFAITPRLPIELEAEPASFDNLADVAELAR